MMKTVSLIVLIAAGNFLLAWIAAFVCMWVIDKKPHRLTLHSNDDIRFFISFFSLFVAVETMIFSFVK